MKRVRKAIANKRAHTDASLGVERDVTDALLDERQHQEAGAVETERQESQARRHEASRQDTDAQLSIERTGTDATVAEFADAKQAFSDAQTADRMARVRAEAALRETERQLRHAQKMEAVGFLAGGVAHDFNNVLSVILSYAELMLSDLKPGEPMHDDLEQIQKAGMRAADLTRQLLMFSRRQLTESKVLDLNDLVSNIDTMLKAMLGADIEVVLLPARPLGRVRVDPGSIEQVVMNLVVNARDAMPTGGKLTIETANVVLDDGFVCEHPGTKPGPHVMLSVTDTGSGMDEATIAHVFEPFFTTKEKGKGTGLGLSIVFGIVQRSGGNVFVYSQLHKGTTFRIYLPCVDSPIDVLRPIEPATNRRGSETILLVEDDDQVRTVSREILRKYGYDVLEARNAGEALMQSEKRSGVIHLLLTDVVMPQVSGPELAERLAAARPDMRLLCMSGCTDDSIVRHGVLEARIAYLQKPITPELLTTAVREVLDSPASAPALKIVPAQGRRASVRPPAALRAQRG